MSMSSGYCLRTTTYFPVRSSLARSVLTKIENDRCLRQIDRQKWYSLSYPELLDDEYGNLFEKFQEDDETKSFIKESEQKSDSIFLQIFQSFLMTLLSLFMSRTSANGLIGRGQMFVYSSAQFQTLIDIDPKEQSTFKTLLDIGAGDGSVTERMSKFFDKTFVTEMSTTMRWRLSHKGYTILNNDDWGNKTFDVITCLNVLDRCEKPISLLKQIHRHLNRERGRLIVGLVLPLNQYFEYNLNHRPNEFLQIDSNKAEQQINQLVKNVFQPLGYRLRKFTRLPYLCEGDLERSFYFLFDYLFVFDIDQLF